MKVENNRNIRRSTISAVVLFNNDTDPNLFKKCIKSLNWCDEVVQIKTDNIKGSFDNWRNLGIKRSKKEWIFYVDSDEVVDESLRKEILSLINNVRYKRYGAYAIPRKNIIFGKLFNYGGQYPDYQKRLFRMESIKGWYGDVHEEPIFKGELGHLSNPLIHNKNMTIAQMVDKTNRWSEIEAKLMFDSGHPKMNFFRFFSAGFRELVLRFVKQKAFMDGKEGVIYGIYQIYSKLISYSKLWEMQQSIIRT